MITYFFNLSFLKGDSIALAALNAKYILSPTHISQRPEYLINLMKRLIVSESNKREPLVKSLNELNKNMNESSNTV